MERAPTRAFSCLKVATIAFTFKNLLKHYANQPARPFVTASQFHVYLLNNCVALCLNRFLNVKVIIKLQTSRTLVCSYSLHPP